MNQRRSEQGGILSFVIIGTVLVLLLVGGIWLAKFQARSVRNAGTVTTSESQSTTQNTTGGTSNPSDSSADSSSTNTASGSTSTTQSSTGSSTSSSTAGTSVPVSGPSTTETLPSTGPTNTFITLLVLASVGAGAYMYAQSNQRLRRSALK